MEKAPTPNAGSVVWAKHLQLACVGFLDQSQEKKRQRLADCRKQLARARAAEALRKAKHEAKVNAQLERDMELLDRVDIIAFMRGYFDQENGSPNDYVANLKVCDIAIIVSNLKEAQAQEALIRYFARWGGGPPVDKIKSGWNHFFRLELPVRYSAEGELEQGGTTTYDLAFRIQHPERSGVEVKVRRVY